MKVLLSIFGLFAFVACSSNERAGIDPAPQFKADAKIENSFGIVKVSDGRANIEDRFRVEIKRSALDKEFLLSANMLTQNPTPQFVGLQSRVVSFIQRGDNLILLDVTKNHVVGEGNIPSTMPLMEIPILADDEDSFVLDLSSGLKNIFTGSDWSGADEGLEAKYELPALPVNFSYTEEVRQDGNALFIRQIAQVEMKSEKKKDILPMELRLQFKPYLPAQDFKPTLSPGFEQVGFFASSPIFLKDGSTRSYATKWNINKPIVFHLSANTPEKYRELFKTSIQYWNKILGEGRVQVEQLDDSTVTAPQFDRNVIQWVDWDNAGYAYADASADPRSGEITSAQIFFPSAFFTYDSQAMLRNLEALNSHPRYQFGLKGFQSSGRCARNLAHLLNSAGLHMGDFKDIPAENQRKVIELLAWETMAHEVGHVMGLMHNFAGNLAANYNVSDRPQLMKKFYQTLHVPPELVMSSSVMEYSRFDESAWNSSQLVHPEKEANSYDKMAMEYLYFAKPLPENRPLFCAEFQLGRYVDCNMGDAGSSIIEYVSANYRNTLKAMAMRILNEYTAKTKMSASGELLIPVTRVSLNLKAYVEPAELDFAKLLSVLKSKQKFVKVRTPFIPFRQNDEALLAAKEGEYLSSEFAKLGGLEKALSPVADDFDMELIANFEKVLMDPDFTSGKLPDGSTYAFTDAEKSVMLDQVKLLAPRLKEALQLSQFKILAGEDIAMEAYGQPKPEEAMKWRDHKLTENLADLLLVRFQEVALGKTEKVLKASYKSKDGKTEASADLPVYKYSQPLRVAAAKLFLVGHDAIEWGYVQKLAQAEAIEGELSLLGEEEKLDKKSLSKEALRWYLLNKQVQAAGGE